MLGTGLGFFFGSLPIRVQGLGVILPTQSQIYTVQAQTAGIVRSVEVGPNDRIDSGRKVAVLSLPVDRAEVESTRKQLRLLQRQLDTQTRFSEQETERRG